jgi:hypothetical protein
MPQGNLGDLASIPPLANSDRAPEAEPRAIYGWAVRRGAASSAREKNVP